MSDDTTTSTPTIETPSTETSLSQVSKPLSVAKPYDDELLEAYESDTNGEGVQANKEESQETVSKELPDAESTDETKEEIKPAERKGDKIEDGFEEVKVKKIINGKEVEFQIKDAVQAYVKQEEFNRNMDKRLKFVDAKEKRWEQEQTRFKGNIEKLVDVAQQGDFIKAIRGLAKIAVGGSGLDVVEFEKKYFEQLDKVRDVYTKMTPEQREAYFAKRSADEARAEANKLKEEKTTQVETSQLQAKVNELQQRYEITPEEFWGNYKTLADAAKEKGDDPNSIQAERVVQFTLAARHEEKVVIAADRFGITDDAVLDEISRITIHRPDLTADDIATIIEKSGLATQASPQAVENLNRKVQKSGTQFSKASSTKEKNGKVNGYDEEDLEFLNRHRPRAYTRVR